jgi:hypothetical protein
MQGDAPWVRRLFCALGMQLSAASGRKITLSSDMALNQA